MVVAQALRKAILEMAPPEGVRLFSIADLVKQTGMSLGVIREAIQHLQSSGLIEVKQGVHGGVFMRRVGEESLIRTLDALVQSNQVPRQHVAEARRELEGLCTRLAAERATSEDILALRGSIEDMRMLVTKPAQFAEENINFHMLICRATSNPVLIAVASALREVFFTTSLNRRYPASLLSEALHAHERILADIESHEAIRAATAMTEHIDAHEQSMRGRPKSSKPTATNR